MPPFSLPCASARKFLEKCLKLCLPKYFHEKASKIIDQEPFSGPYGGG